MKILAIEKELPGLTEERVQPFLKAEAARVYDLYQQGLIRETYFHADCHTAVLVLECTDGIEALAILATLPLVSEGLITFDVIPLVPYTGFSRLIKPIP